MTTKLEYRNITQCIVSQNENGNYVIIMYLLYFKHILFLVDLIIMKSQKPSLLGPFEKSFIIVILKKKKSGEVQLGFFYNLSAAPTL